MLQQGKKEQSEQILAHISQWREHCALRFNHIYIQNNDTPVFMVHALQQAVRHGDMAKASQRKMVESCDTVPSLPPSVSRNFINVSSCHVLLVYSDHMGTPRGPVSHFTPYPKQEVPKDK